ncbi:hypothetical protein K6U42_12420, partial [Vibrio parahaemolyticus]|nr:hypothetical protein [Vibrio parahaemolyticus]
MSCAANRADIVLWSIKQRRAAWCFACASASLIPAGLVSSRVSFCGCASGRKKERLQFRTKSPNIYLEGR